MDVAQPYRAMAYNNAWANHRLLTACLRLSAAEFAAPRTGFFPSLRATLNHIVIIDRFYVDALEGGTLGLAALRDPEPCPDAASLRAAQAAVDRRLIAVTEGLDVAALERVVRIHRGERVQEERMDRLLLHLFQHQVHHRGQAHAMLSGTSVPPPQLDEFFSEEEWPLRAAELAELGLSEAVIWARRPGGGRD
ncbi:MAG TPA: DinB family protein [Azospirillaceae bacterium]|nr:DinB family protein [Azospirillaceae bacterium]